jgi:prepilin-type N-terminal cleavage/methylation domain-containing protein
MRFHRRRSETDGFSLVELIVVIMILAIVAAVVVPLASSGQDAAATSAARLVAADLQYAQNLAITFQKPITMTFDTAGNSYTLSDASGPLMHPIRKADYVVDLNTEAGMEKVEIVSASFGGAPAVTFDELGAPDNSGSVDLQAKDFSYEVSLSAVTGKVTVKNTTP